MDETVGRRGEALGPGDRVVAIALAALLGVLVIGVAAATRFDVLLPAAVISLALLALLVSLRWPLVPLLAFAALIPFEEIGRFAGLGTISRIAAALFVVTYALPRLGRLTLSAMPLAGWLFVAWLLLSATWAHDPNTSILEIPTLLQLFVMSVVVADVVVHRPTIVRPLMWAYSLSATVTAAVGAASFLTSGPGVGRVAAFQDQDAAQFAALLLPAFVFGISELVAGRRWPPHSMVIVAICTAAIMLSGTRGAWVSVVVVLIAFILPQLRPRRRVAAVVLTLVVVLGTLQLPGAADLLGERADLALRTGGAGRTDIWSVATTIIQSAPLSGVGFANFPVAFASELNRTAGIEEIAGPHSILFGTLGELGIVGLVLLVLFVGPLVVRSGWGPDAQMIRAALGSLVVAAFFLDVLSNRKQVWLIIGIAAGLAYLSRRVVRAPTTTGAPAALAEPPPRAP